MKCKYIFALALITTTTACSMGPVGSVNDYFGPDIVISATEEGMKAFSDYQTGLVTTGKASPDGDNAHHELRRMQETTKQIKIKTFSQKLKEGRVK